MSELTDLSLPMDAQRLIPHRSPLRFVDRLREFSVDSGIVEATVPSDNPLADKGGAIDPILSLEMMAQAYAAVKGYRDRLDGLPVGKGFLVGVRRFHVSEALSIGDNLLITVKTVGSFAGFAVADAAVVKGGREIASATLKFWIPDDSAPEAERQ